MSNKKAVPGTVATQPNDTNASNPVTTTELITPALAAQWLKLNRHNRALTAQAVTSLAASIKAGQWRVTHQGIAFGKDGSLYDGQHRLYAIVEANIPVTMRVTRGLTKESLDAIDTGTSRKPQDVLAIADGVQIDHHTRAAYMAARCLVENGYVSGRSPVRCNVHALREAIREHGESMSAILAVPGITTGRLCNAALIGSLAILHRSQPEKAIEFATKIASGADLADGHPALALRNFMLTSNSPGKSHRTRNELSSKTFSAFDAFMSGEYRSFLKRSSSATEKYLRPWRSTAA